MLGRIVRIAVVSLVAALLWAGTAEAQRRHRVRPGQSLSQIARRYGVSPDALAAANDLTTRSLIRPGDVLLVPGRGEIFVRPGQTLSQIARANRCSLRDLMRVNRLRETSTLRPGMRLILPGHEPPPPERDWGEPDQPGVVTLVRRGEREQVRLVDAEGRVLRTGLRRLGWFMRRHDEDPEARPHPRLARLLAAISDRFGGQPITIVSGAREAGGRTRETSRHVAGQAADINVEGVHRRSVWDYCRSLESTGCGLYPRSSFVHVDARERSMQWVDWSGPGQRARYGNLRGPGRARRRAMAVERRDLDNRAHVPLAIEVVEDDPTWQPAPPAFARFALTAAELSRAARPTPEDSTL